MGFNSGFKGLILYKLTSYEYITKLIEPYSNIN